MATLSTHYISNRDKPQQPPLIKLKHNNLKIKEITSLFEKLNCILSYKN